MRKVQWPVAGLLSYALYLTVICPCNKTLSCHQRQFFLSTGAAGTLVWLENNGML